MDQQSTLNMKLKNKIEYLLLFIGSICCLSLFAQPVKKVSVADFQGLLGKWHGKMIIWNRVSKIYEVVYKDIEIKQILKADKFILKSSFPARSGEILLEYLIISDSGKFVNKETIKHNKKLPYGRTEITTETPLADNKSVKTVRKRHTYVITEKTYSILEEIRSGDDKKWLTSSQLICTRASL
jgi:hypothetical protein